MDKMQELLKQRAEIDKQIEQQREAGKADALNLVKSVIEEYGFTATQLKSVLKTRGRPKAIKALRNNKATATQKQKGI